MADIWPKGCCRLADRMLEGTLELSVVRIRLFVGWYTAVAAAVAEEWSHWVVHMPRWA